MTIKQLEEQLGISRATIRFYEKEKLINPKRNDNSYREYSEEDVIILKKVIILRKVGLSVSDIKKALDGECSLQSLLEKNILDLQNQMKELEGAISLSKIMQDRKEEITSLDANEYWKEMDVLEKSGLKFMEIINDVIAFEKGVILNEFQLVNEEGKLLYNWKESILRAVGLCVASGLIWYLLEGKDRTYHNFLEGFFWPFVCIIASSVFGLPVYFIGKKNPQLAEKIKTIGTVIAAIIVVGVIGLAIALSI